MANIPPDRPRNLKDICFQYVHIPLSDDEEDDERVEILQEDYFPDFFAQNYVIVIGIYTIQDTILTEGNLAMVGLTWLDLLGDDEM